MAVPSSLDVRSFTEARGAEIQSLFDALQQTAGKNVKNRNEDKLASVVEIRERNRRRTRSHNRHKTRFWAQKDAKPSSRKRKREACVVKEEERQENAGKSKKELKLASLSRRVRRRVEFQQVVAGKSTCCKDGTRRLCTHVWHAKRFYMSKLWGYWLPEGLHGSGKGVKAVLRWASTGVVVHDASYNNAIQLEGPQGEVARILSLVLEEPFSASNESRHEIGCYYEAMLHRCGRVPFSPIAPATVVFCSGKGKEANTKLWILVHAAAYEEALKSVQTACEGKANSVCHSRLGGLARLEVFGKNSTKTLQTILKARDDQKTRFLRKVFTEETKNLSLPLDVYDPREISSLEKKMEDVVAEGGTSIEETSISPPKNRAFGGETWQSIINYQSSVEQHNTSLWGLESDVEPPLTENAVSKKRHMSRLSSFHLSDEGDQRTKTSSWRKCPIVLLKRNYKAFHGYSILLPSTWTHAFWMSLVLSGAHVIGQNERRWLMAHVHATSFPYDFPDCPSYKEHVTAESKRQMEENEKKPPGKRLPAPSHGPAWLGTPDAGSVSNSGELIFHGFLARSRSLLTAYCQLHGITSFPGAFDDNKPNDGRLLSLVAQQKTCFCRVMVRPAGAGVVDEGSVLYIPEPNDFEDWQKRSGSWPGIDIKNGPRNIIGFVTSAAPYKSRDAAVAFCNVIELSKLWSWQALDGKQNTGGESFFVLFRNSRSPKLRPAIGSAVLEG